MARNQPTHKSYTIATLGSHSALGILKGAKEEGFKTLCICKPQDRITYDSFGVADKIIETASFSDFPKLKGIDNKTIFIPHGSYTAYVDMDDFPFPIFGNRELIKVESNRDTQREWIVKSGLKVPEVYHSTEDIDGLVIVKFHGAAGGKGYFLAYSRENFEEKRRRMVRAGIVTEKQLEKIHIQKYIIGVNVYASYFNSVVRDELELLCFDKRYEANVDNIGRVPAEDQIATMVTPTYTVTGNIPLSIRESLLPEFFRMGEAVARTARGLSEKGMIGPFCLENVINQKLEIITFELSARIVAGTNVDIGGGPYFHLKHGPGMHMGRRIALEIKEGIQQGMLDELLT